MKTISINDQGIIEQLFEEALVCHLAMSSTAGQPYVVPMNYLYHEGYCYFHSGPHGKKIELLKTNPQVCISISKGEDLVMQDEETACSYSMKSRSIVFEGTVVFIESMEEKREVLDLLMKRFSNRQFTYSEPALRNVVIWKVKTDNLSMRILGLTVKEAQFISQ